MTGKKLSGRRSPPPALKDSLSALFQSGQYVQAEKAALELTSRHPSDPFGWKVLGILLAENQRYSEALIPMRKAVELAPTDLSGLNNLGIVLKELNHTVEAEAVYRSLIRKDPSLSEAYCNLGELLRQQGRLVEAAQHLEEAINLNPHLAPAYTNLGLVQRELGELLEAEANLRAAISIRPKDPLAHNNMGGLLRDQGRLSEAKVSYRRAISIRGDFAQAHNNLGQVCLELGLLFEAEASCSKAIELQPRFAQAFNNLGIVKHELGRLDESRALLNKAIESDPDYAQPHNNLGNVLKDQTKFELAEESYRRAILIDGDYAEAHNNLGVLLKDNGNFEDAEASYLEAVRCRPDFAEAHNNLAHLDLTKKDFEKGFKLVEWRWKTKQNIGQALKSKKPRWSGERNERVFVWSEQGLGDVIMFSSLLVEIHEISEKVIVSCDKRLIALFSRSLPKDISFFSSDEAVSEEQYDFQIPIASLAVHFRRNDKSFRSSSSGFLNADPELVSDFRSRLSAHGVGAMCGISWRGGQYKPGTTRVRHIELNAIAKVLADCGQVLVNLQYGDVENELNDLEKIFGMKVISFTDLDNKQDIDGLSALISACDRVVSVDNTTVHISGSLGVSTKVLLPAVSDWRWARDSNKSYWYDSLTLYRQKRFADWSDPLRELGLDLNLTNSA